MTSPLTFAPADDSFGPVPVTMAEAQVRIRHLEAALATRHIIGIAQGILMERERLTVESAFERLRRVSQNTNVRLASVAMGLVHTGAIAESAKTRRRAAGGGAERLLQLIE